MDGGIGESMLLSAAIGGGTSALRGGSLQDDLKGALLGGVGGAAFSGLGSALGSAGATTAGATAGATPGVAGDVSSNLLAGASNAGAINPMAATPDIAGGGSSFDSFGNPVPQGSASAISADPTNMAATTQIANNAATQAGQSNGIMSQLGDKWNSLSTTQKMMLGGGAGLGALMLADRNRYGVPKPGIQRGPLSQFGYNPSTFSPSLPYAEGGIAGLAGGGLSHGASRSGALRNTLGMLHGVEHLSEFSHGGALGGYSDGGQMLKGPGDGMSDSIPAHIDGKQPARLADGEFVVPADVVSHLGNGSTDAGAKHLYDMMDKVRKARTGNPKQGKQINASKFLPT
jgi:hypothetical protein